MLLFSLKLSSGENQKKKKGKGSGYGKKEQNKVFIIIYCRRYVSMIKNQISGYLYIELFNKNNEEKWTAFQSIVWSLIVHKNTIKNCSTTLQEFSFRSLALSILYFLFHKDKGTSGIAQPSVQYLIYVFLHFYSFS